jgi:hypothetical protein
MSLQQTGNFLSVKTRGLQLENADGSIPAVGAVMTANARGGAEWTIDPTVNSLTARDRIVLMNGETASGVLTYVAGVGLRINGTPISTGGGGAKGDTGLQGPTGPKGDTGLQGATGVKGDTGLQGASGLQGATGPQGDAGLQGATGVKGDTGLQGATGVKGDTGLQGPAGTMGAVTDLDVSGTLTVRGKVLVDISGLSADISGTGIQLVNVDTTSTDIILQNNRDIPTTMRFLSFGGNGYNYVQSGSVIAGGSASPLLFTGMLGAPTAMVVDVSRQRVRIGDSTMPTSTLDVAGITTLGGNTTVSSGNLSVVSGSTTLGGTLQVTSGATTLSRTLDVSGATTLNATTVRQTLDVSGATTLNATTVRQTLDVNGATTIDVDYSFAQQSANPLPAQLSVRGVSNGNQLKLGAYYTGGVGASTVIQSTDVYDNADHPQKLLLNPLGGYVGIAKTPTAPLDVSGNTNITGNLTVSGTVTATNFIFSVQSV